MKRSALVLCASLVCYLALILPFTRYLREKPFAEKMGPVPQGELLRLVSADQKQLTAFSLVMKTLFYFGGMVDNAVNKLNIPPDYPAISRTIHASVKVDPYNLDAYYLAQAILAWDARQPRIANDLLDYGMRYRTWDMFLPMFAGFNSAFFLKDYAAAARYYKAASDLSGQELYLYRNLAARYMQESGQTPLALSYLSSMLKSERNPAIRKIYETKLAAFKGVRAIEVARDRFRFATGRAPQSVEELRREGYLQQIPVDPYGGTFYIDAKGQVRSTSKFAFGARAQGNQPSSPAGPQAR